MDNLACSVATENDIPFISETYHENMASLHGVHKSYDVWKELLSSTDSVYYIVRSATPVAWFRTDVEDGEFWLGMLQVKSMYHHQGIGKYILSKIEEIAKENRFQKIGIHTTEDNLAARALYVSAGYSLTEIGPCTTGDGVDRVGYTFHKQMKI